MGTGESCGNAVSIRKTETLCPMIVGMHFFTTMSTEH